MSNLDALFQQFGVKSSSTGSGDTAQNQQVKIFLCESTL